MEEMEDGPSERTRMITKTPSAQLNQLSTSKTQIKIQRHGGTKVSYEIITVKYLLNSTVVTFMCLGLKSPAFVSEEKSNKRKLTHHSAEPSKEVFCSWALIPTPSVSSFHSLNKHLSASVCWGLMVGLFSGKRNGSSQSSGGPRKRSNHRTQTL